MLEDIAEDKSKLIKALVGVFVVMALLVGGAMLIASKVAHTAPIQQQLGDGGQQDIISSGGSSGNIPDQPLLSPGETPAAAPFWSAEGAKQHAAVLSAAAQRHFATAQAAVRANARAVAAVAGAVLLLIAIGVTIFLVVRHQRAEAAMVESKRRADEEQARRLREEQESRDREEQERQAREAANRPAVNTSQLTIMIVGAVILVPILCVGIGFVVWHILKS